MRSSFRARFTGADRQKTVSMLIGRARTSCQATRVRGSIQYDDRDQPAVVRLLSMRRSAIAKEAPLVGVGVEAKILEASDACACGALRNVGVEVEHRVAWPAARGEVARCVVARAFEGGDEFWANPVGFLADAGSERGDNVAALGAKPLHRCNGRFHHS